MPSEMDELKNLSAEVEPDLKRTKPVAAPPFGAAMFACIFSLILTAWLTQSMVARLAIWWFTLLIYILIPTAVTFSILYRSSWHRELFLARRTASLFLLSLAILAGSVCFFGVAVMAVCTVCAGFTRWHY